MPAPDFIQCGPEALAKKSSKSRSLPSCAIAFRQVDVDSDSGLPAVSGWKLSATPLMQ